MHSWRALCGLGVGGTRGELHRTEDEESGVRGHLLRDTGGEGVLYAAGARGEAAGAADAPGRARGVLTSGASGPPCQVRAPATTQGVSAFIMVSGVDDGGGWPIMLAPLQSPPAGKAPIEAGATADLRGGVVGSSCAMGAVGECKRFQGARRSVCDSVEGACFDTESSLQGSAGKVKSSHGDLWYWEAEENSAQSP